MSRRGLPEGMRIDEVEDERTTVAEAALRVIAASFPPGEVHPLEELRMEVAETRLGLLNFYDFHLLALRDAAGAVVGAGAGVYLAGVNAGLVTYLATRPEVRGRRLGREVRAHLVERFQADARRAEWETLHWVLGEVRRDSPWLRRLVRVGSAVPFDLTYFHPGQSPDAATPYVLYREPVGDHRRALPADEVRRILYAVWRRGYRVRYPLARAAFQRMLEELEGREEVGPHPDFRVPEPGPDLPAPIAAR